MYTEPHTEQSSNFRLDVPLHELLTKPRTPSSGPQPVGEPQRFPEPAFP
jgi:hypothetical protein